MLVPMRAGRADNLISGYVSRLFDCLKAMNHTEIIELARAIGQTRHSGGTVWIAGNGGSASTASHMAVDLMLGTELTKPPLRVVSLADNFASITATGNDIEFTKIFSRQVSKLGAQGDLLIVISASGNSPNLLSAIDEARELGIKTAGILAFDGGKIAKVVDLLVHVPTALGEYGIAEDAHLAINHIIKDLLKTNSLESAG